LIVGKVTGRLHNNKTHCEELSLCFTTQVASLGVETIAYTCAFSLHKPTARHLQLDLSPSQLKHQNNIKKMAHAEQFTTTTLPPFTFIMTEPTSHPPSPSDLNYQNPSISVFGTLTPIIGFVFGGMLGALAFSVIYLPLYFCLRPGRRYRRRDPGGGIEGGDGRE
jgi:hypothetical protein